jgi:hypothetical protein
MIMNSFPRTQGTLSRESYLTLLLLALVDQAGGELRISAQSLEKLDSGGKVLVDWDVASQQAVIRIGSPSLVVAEVRGSGWTSTTPTAQPPAQTPDPTKHRVMTEDAIIERAAQMLRQDQLRQWREQGAAAVSNMPPPEDRRA